MKKSQHMLPQRLKELRKKNNLSQYKLAEELGVSRGLLSNYEQGSREPDFNTLMLIADYYCVSIDYLMGITNVKQRFLSTEEQNKYYSIFEDITGLEKESLDELQKYIDLLKIRDNLHHAENKKLSGLTSKRNIEAG